jgi:hypothetical protein
MRNIRPAVLNVGAGSTPRDPIGPFHVYRAVERNNPGTTEHAGDGAVVPRLLVAWRRRSARAISTSG